MDREGSRIAVGEAKITHVKDLAKRRVGYLVHKCVIAGCVKRKLVKGSPPILTNRGFHRMKHEYHFRLCSRICG